MDERTRERLGVLLEQVLTLPPDERVRFLDDACHGDVALRAEIESLLNAFESSTRYFDDLVPRMLAPLVEEAFEGAHDDVAIGGTIAHYRVLERIGGGGMGVVYRANDLRLGRDVALKFLSPRLTLDATARARLMAEAQAVSILDHPAIGVVHDIGETDAGRLFIVMAWYAGETLKAKLEDGPLSHARAIAIAHQLASALAAAHAAGIIHRDVKPSNVLITALGGTKLLDFGIAKVPDTELTQGGATPGTVAYMSPEQLRGAKVDERTDLWSLGIVLYEMIAGQRPFSGQAQYALIHEILQDEPEPIARLCPSVPAPLAALVDRCLSKDPALRHASADDVAAALGAIVGGTDANIPFSMSGADMRRAGTPGKRVVPAARVRSKAGLLAGIAAAVVLAGSYAVMVRGSEPTLNDRRVVVARFENQTGDPSLDPVGSMAADWIIQGLNHAGLPNIVPVTAALSASRFVIGSVGVDTAERIGLLARETGAAIVVSGAYYRQLDSIYLVATVTDARRDRLLNAVEPIAASSAAPLDAIQEMRERLMSIVASLLSARMHEHAVRPGRSLPSFDAYRAHAEGIEYFIAGDWDAAIARFTEAAAPDSTFVEPLLFTGLAYINLGNLAAVDSILTLARPHLQTLHQAERLGFEYLDATVRGDRQEAYRVHQRYPELAPGGLAHWALANTALAVNRPRETVRVSRQLDPGRGELRGWYLYWRDLGRAHHMLGEHREELDIARRATELFPDEALTRVAEARALAAMGRVDEVNDLLRRHVYGGATTLRLRQQAALEFFAHDFPDEAEAVLREGVDPTTGPGTFGARLIVAQNHSLLGQDDRAEAILRELAAAYPTSITVRGALGVLLARRGLVDEATRSATWLADLDRPYMHGSNTYWRARIAAQLGSLDLAVQLIQQAFREGVGVWDDFHRNPDFAPLRDYGPFIELLRARG